MEQFARTELIIGKQGVEKLKRAKVAIFGIGGVGSYTVEALARAGIGQFVLVDKDVVDGTNLNRQIIATHATIGKPKVEVAKQRILEINPQAIVQTYEQFYLPESVDKIIDETFSYVVDAVDTVTAKLEIIEQAKKHQVRVISCMGTGNKMDPTKFEVSDITKTLVCPLAKIMRKELKARNIEQVKVVYSKEEPIAVEKNKEERKQTPGSVSFVPSVAGLIMAGEVIKDIIKIENECI